MHAQSCSIDQAAAQEQLACPAVADLPGQVVHDDRRDQPAPNLGVADPGGFRGDRHVASRHQAGPTGDCIAIDRGDRRLRQRVQPLEQVGELLKRGDGLLLRIGGSVDGGGLLQVHARAKGRTRPRQHDRSDLFIDTQLDR